MHLQPPVLDVHAQSLAARVFRIHPRQQRHAFRLPRDGVGSVSVSGVEPNPSRAREPIRSAKLHDISRVQIRTAPKHGRLAEGALFKVGVAAIRRGRRMLATDDSGIAVQGNPKHQPAFD